MGKRGRANLNQAEVQKRYRERKKNRMLDLEKQVEDLREKVKELEREKARGGDGSDLKEAFGSGDSTPPDAATTTEGGRSSDDDTTTLLRPFAVVPGDGDPEFTERMLREDAARRSRDSEGLKSDSGDGSGCEGHLTFIIEAAQALKRGVDGPSATGKFKNYTEAEIWWGGVTEVYNKAVRNIRDLVDVGANDSDLRSAIDAISNVVSVARESRSELAVISTLGRTTESMQKDLASKGLDLRAACRTSCALLAKSVVDASMQSQNTQEVLTKLQNELPPKDLKIIVNWYESYFEELMKIGNGPLQNDSEVRTYQAHRGRAAHAVRYSGLGGHQGGGALRGGQPHAHGFPQKGNVDVQGRRPRSAAAAAGAISGAALPIRVPVSAGPVIPVV